MADLLAKAKAAAEAPSAVCVTCGARPGDEYGPKHILLTPRLFFHDHLYDWEPTWLSGRDLESFRQQLKMSRTARLSGYMLCLQRCQDQRGWAAPGRQCVSQRT